MADLEVARGRAEDDLATPEDTGGRRSRLAGGLGAEGARGALVATASTVVLVAVVAILVVRSPGWEAVRERFLSGADFRASLPDVADGFLLNVRMFLVAEVCILVLALVVALVRSLPGPAAFPLRALAVVYTDLFRGIPVILVIFALGFGVPALRIDGLPTDPVVYGVVALVLVYGAYVAEVYRAGIDSVHESQVAAARSLGLSRGQALRHVVLPQAVRRVVPPLLNDFIGLQKDTALVALIGPLEAVRQAQIYSARTFTYTSYLAAALLFVAVTIPLARFTDHLVARDRRRRLAGAG